MIHLVEIDSGNWRIPLRVSPDQEIYVANTTVILARAYAFRNEGSQVFLIYDDETPVGMVLYYECPEYEEYIFSELLIDERYQRNGYGREATRLILDRMKEESKYPKVCLCFIEGNEAAKKLYESFGFAETDRDDDEVIMELALR